jgi:hypothetical protein
MGESRTSLPPAARNGDGKSALDRLRDRVAQGHLYRDPAQAQQPDPDDALSFKVAANAALAQGYDRDSNITARLEKKFGLGRDPKRRRELFRRLESMVRIHGEVAYDVVNACVADAVGKEKPAHWFCRSVVSRLRDRGLLLSGLGGDPSW